MKKLIGLASGTPSYDNWQEATRLLDAMPPEEQAEAVLAFEAASSHWPTALDPWTGMTLAPGQELRRSPPHWVKEVYSGQHAPKHALVRILESPRRPMSGQKLENLLAPEAQVTRARQVGFDQAKVSGGFLKALKGDGVWRRWRALRLWTCDLKAPALKLLGAAELSSLEMLNLEQNRMGEAGLAGLAKAPGLSALTAVHLGSNALDASALRALGAMPWSRQLTWLNLSYNPVYDVALDHLVHAGLPSLRTLDVSHTQVGLRGEAWAAGMPGLESLRLNNTAATDEGVAALLPRLPALHSLSLDATQVGDATARAIAEGPQRWRALSLQSTQLTAEGLGAMLRAPSLAEVERLELGAGFDLANAKLLIDGACPRLKHLWWYGPEIGAGVEAAVRASPRLAATLAY
ncbi:MAG: hypothetical protein R3A48_11885 [Polyangiales bacterium]